MRLPLNLRKDCGGFALSRSAIFRLANICSNADREFRLLKKLPPRAWSGRAINHFEAHYRQCSNSIQNYPGSRRQNDLTYELACEFDHVANDEAVKIGKAFTAFAHGRDLALAAELHRTRAVLLLRADPGERGAAEADLRSALEIGRQQDALSLQLRAARDLARLLAERGERQQAADLLAGTYREFKEGFDTPDLTEAKALLDDLQA